MKYSPKKIFDVFQKRITPLLTKRTFRIIFFLPLILIVGTAIVITVYFSQLPPQIPLYYSRPWGDDQLTTPIFLFLLPLGSLFWYLVTVVCIAFETHQYRVFSQLLLIFSLIVTVLATYTVGTILILVL